MDLSVNHWEGATSAEREAIARRLAKQLPAGFTFQAVSPYRLGERLHHVALFQKGAAAFALVPGGTVSLGLRRRPALGAQPGRAGELAGHCGRIRHRQDASGVHPAVTLRVRRVEISPLLIETAAVEVGWE